SRRRAPQVLRADPRGSATASLAPGRRGPQAPRPVGVPRYTEIQHPGRDRETVVLVKMNRRGTLTVPKELRRGLDEQGRVQAVRGVPGVWELTWSFAGPAGRATFELIAVDGEPAIRWRRVGGHEIFREP